MSETSYSGLHIAVTGASSGIGEAIVREYARLGAKVTLVARRREQMEAIAAQAGGRTQIFPADLTDVVHATDWLAPAQAAFGPIDILVNNAGVQIVDDFSATDVERAEKLLLIDLHTPLRLTRAVVPDMIARKSGTIVDVASLAAIAPTPGMVYYNAAKAGLAAASESLRGELRGTGVHVVTVYPGPVETAMGRAGYAALESTPSVRATPKGTPEVLARLVRRAVERKKARVIYPWIYTFARHLPGLTRWSLDRFSPKVVRGQTQAQPQLPPAGR
jgi:short-subunit dehydrogenase